MVDKITLLGNIILRYIKLCETQCQYYRDKSDIKICIDKFNYLVFKYFGIERTRRRLFQIRDVRTKFDIYVFINKQM